MNQNVELLRPSAAKKTEDVLRAEQVREEIKARKADIQRQRQNKNNKNNVVQRPLLFFMNCFMTSNSNKHAINHIKVLL